MTTKVVHRRPNYRREVTSLRGHVPKQCKPVCGVGICDIASRKDGKVLLAYKYWLNMINRCYSKAHLSKRPTYVGCSVCAEWLTFSVFKAWFDINYIAGYSLDKDLLVPGNKTYGPKTCKFVPQWLNTIVGDHRRARGIYPCGVVLHKQSGLLHITIQKHGKQISLGYSKDVNEAAKRYRIAKRKHVRFVAEEAYDQGLIDEELYASLKKWRPAKESIATEMGSGNTAKSCTTTQPKHRR